MTGKNTPKRIPTKTNSFKEIADSFEQLVKHADRFLKPQPEQFDAIQQLIQQTYRVSINSDVDNQKDVLPELVLEQMDEEQIWQQLELRNDLVFPQFIKQTAHLTVMREQNLGIELDDDNDKEDEEENVSEQDDEEDGEEQQSEGAVESDEINERSTKQVKAKSNKKYRKSMVDDTFFKLDEMKQFLEQEDAKEMRRHKNKNAVDDSEGIDYFAEDFGVGEDSDDEEDDDANINYADFFDMDEELQEEAQKQKKDKNREFFVEEKASEQDELEDEASDEQEEQDEDDQNGDVASEIDEAEFVAKSGVEPASDSDSDDDNNDKEENEEEKTPSGPQSSNEMREVRLLQRIRDYEDVVLGDKPWQLKGEVQAGHRPQNSLLEEILEFDSTRRPVAAITEEQNETIEDIIKQRIRDKAWDDVVRTVRPVHTPQEYRKQLVLDQEKSKQSLAQIYEQQYQRELDKMDPNRDADDSAAPEPKEHQEIKRAMRNLFLKLDALSNFHFTPKPVAPEAKIVTNTPAVHMEEVAPVAVSDAKLLAPEEVFRGPKHTPLGKTERTRTDKNRERRKKKQKQRAINAAVESRDLQRAKEGKAPTQREANAKLLKSITKNRNVQKITSSNDQSALKSSKAFFNKLQDTTTSASASTASKRPKKDTSKVNAKKLKL